MTTEPGWIDADTIPEGAAGVCMFSNVAAKLGQSESRAGVPSRLCLGAANGA